MRKQWHTVVHTDNKTDAKPGIISTYHGDSFKFASLEITKCFFNGNKIIVNEI